MPILLPNTLSPGSRPNRVFSDAGLQAIGRQAFAVLLLLLTAACSDAGGNNAAEGNVLFATNADSQAVVTPANDPASENALPNTVASTSQTPQAQAEQSQTTQSGSAQIYRGRFELSIIDTPERVFSDELQGRLEAFLRPAIEAVNDVVSLPQDIPVSVRSCNVVNAFYLPALPEIYLCMELLDESVSAFSSLFDNDRDLALQASEGTYTWFAYHEVAHALHHQLNLPIAGNTESAADSIASVLSIEKGDAINVYLAALLFFNTGNDSFSDVHPSGTDRAGDMICWALGGDPQLAQTQTGAAVAQDFIDEGRDCVSEYATQLNAVEQWIPDLPLLASLANRERTGNNTGQLNFEQVMEIVLMRLASASAAKSS